MKKYNENPKHFQELCVKPHQGSALDPLGGSQHLPNPPADYSDRGAIVSSKY